MHSDGIGVIFDLDGTLVASEVLYFDATQSILVPLGRSLTELTPSEKSLIPGRSAVVNMEFYRQRFGLEPSAEDLVESRMDQIIARVHTDGVDVIPGAESFVGSLDRAGFRLAVASSAPRRYVEPVLERTNLGRFFDVVKTGSDVTRFKPEPEIFEKALSDLGLKPDRGLVVEDAHSGIQAAIAAGMRVLAIRSEYTLPEQYNEADRLIDDYRGLGPDDVRELLGR